MYNLIKRNKDIRNGITLTIESGNGVKLFDFNPHINLHGLPQPLKSYIISDITATLTTQYSHEEVKLVYNSKYETVNSFSLDSNTKELENGIITVLDVLKIEMKMRENILDAKGYDGSIARIVVILDYHSLANENVMKLVEPIINKGERLGVHLMIV